MMITPSTTQFLMPWTTCGVPIHVIGLLFLITRKFSASIPDFINPAWVGWTLSLKIGLTMTTGFVPWFIWRAKLVRHMKLFSAKGTLIVPVWTSAHFWPLLCSDRVQWSNFIHDWVILPNFPNLFVACKAKNSVFGLFFLLFVSVALRIDFSIPLE